MFLLTRQGERKRIAWSFTRLSSGSPGSPAFVASGIDITEQQLALAQLDRVDAALQGTLAEERLSVLPPAAIDERHFEKRHPRRAYPYIQAIGPCRDGSLPDLLEFHNVRCRDILSRSFSFITPEPPDYLELIVTFGSPPSQLFLRPHRPRHTLSTGYAPGSTRWLRVYRSRRDTSFVRQLTVPPGSCLHFSASVLAPGRESATMSLAWRAVSRLPTIKSGVR